MKKRSVATLATLDRESLALVVGGLNPQPFPPGLHEDLNPQPLPPGIRAFLNPQPLPPGLI
jgi:hypothetical protein